MHIHCARAYLLECRAPASVAAHPLHEELFKRLPELPGHPAVDPEVERVAQTDTEVYDQNGGLDDGVVEEVVDGRGHRVQDCDDAEGKLHGQEDLK